MVKTKQNRQQVVVSKNTFRENIVCDAFKSDLFKIFFICHVNIFIVFSTFCSKRIAKRY